MSSPRAGRTTGGLPLAYLLTAALAFVLAAVGVPLLAADLARHYYNPHVVALAHTITLGWITLALMGATYQLVPVILERPVWSVRLAWCQYALMVAGIVGMVGHFYIAQWAGLVWSASLVAVAVVLHIVHVGLTLRGLRAWTFTARLLVLALAGLGLTVAFGVVLGLDRTLKFLPTPFFPTIYAHLHLALLGWVAPMVVGVGARIYPTFLVGRDVSPNVERIELFGLALGFPAIVVGLLVAPVLVAPGTLVVATTLAAHAWCVLTMVRTRARPSLDWGLRFVLTGVAFLMPAAIIGLGFGLGLLGGPRLGAAYAVLALGGWVSLTIAGMLLKMVTFIVRSRLSVSRAAPGAVPGAGPLGWPAAEATTWMLLTFGVAALAVAVALGEPLVVRVAGVAIAAGALAFAATLARMLHHLVPCPLRRAARVSAGAEAR